MSQQEAQQMARLLARHAGEAQIRLLHNDQGHYAIQVTWETGPVLFETVRGCIRMAKWLYACKVERKGE